MSEPISIDLRGMPMDPRHELLFETLFGLRPGESMEVVNDHDSSGLAHRLAAEYPGRFAWTWIERGPADWRFRIDRAPESTEAA
jgi:uncharacterized protein (DUF2249 family)